MEQPIISPEMDKLSKINSAALINLRLSNLWIDVNKDARAGSYKSWNHDLDRVWCELGGDVKEKSTSLTDFKKLNEKVSKSFKGLNLKKDGFSGYSEEQKESMVGLYNSLMEKELFLRRLMNKQGKGTAYQEEEDWD